MGKTICRGRYYFSTRFVDGGFLSNLSAGRIGLRVKFPPQFGQMFSSFVTTHSLQKVHSKLHIIALVDSGGRSISQRSQLGFNLSMEVFAVFRVVIDLSDQLEAFIKPSTDAANHFFNRAL